MNLPVSDLVVSFRDADQPRPLAARLIAVAHRHPSGWTVNVPDGTIIDSVTFDAAADAVITATGVRHLLIVWTALDRDGADS
jgi:hypothetical protein